MPLREKSPPLGNDPDAALQRPLEQRVKGLCKPQLLAWAFTSPRRLCAYYFASQVSKNRLLPLFLLSYPQQESLLLTFSISFTSTQNLSLYKAIKYPADWRTMPSTCLPSHIPLRVRETGTFSYHVSVLSVCVCFLRRSMWLVFLLPLSTEAFTSSPQRHQAGPVTRGGVVVVISSQKLKDPSCQSPSQPSAKSAHISKVLSLSLNPDMTLS